MGGDDSQKLLPWRGPSFLSGARYTSGVRSNQLYRKCLGMSAAAPARSAADRQPGSLLPSRDGSLLGSSAILVQVRERVRGELLTSRAKRGHGGVRNRHGHTFGV
jgi:hypothetical protein